MLKKAIGIIMALTLAAVGCVVFNAADNQLVMEVVAAKDKKEIRYGELLQAELKITKNTKGFNSFTFFVDYDPELILPVGAGDTDTWLKAGNGSSDPIITAEAINTQIGVTPSADDPDYAGLGADGVKTAAELGRIKLASTIFVGGKPVSCSQLGTLCSIQFEPSSSTKGGNAEIKITGVNSGFAPVMTKGSSELLTDFHPVTVKVSTQSSLTVDNVKYTVDSSTGELISAETSEKEIDVPASVNGVYIRTIAEGAFKGSPNATTISLPTGVTKIAKAAFSGHYVTTVNLPNTVTEIGEYAFSNCEKLSKIDIPGSVTIIDEGAFKNCKSITEVNITRKTNLGIGCFSGCSSLKKVNFVEADK